MIEHILVYVCDECGARVEHRHGHPISDGFGPGAALRFPCPPETWRLVDGRLICNAHRVEVKVT